mgnify:CR=1 FL=1
MRIEADYRIETGFDLSVAAEAMAGEQSSGTFLPVPGETPELKARAAARVERIEELGEVPVALPGAGKGSGVVRAAKVTLSWPLANIGPSLPNLLATVAGNLFELKYFSGLRLLDLRLPVEFVQRYGGPAFGVAGTRAMTGVQGRPLIGTIIKPSIGLTPGYFGGNYLGSAHHPFVAGDPNMAKYKVKDGHTGRCVSQRTAFLQHRRKNQMVHCRTAARVRWILQIDQLLASAWTGGRRSSFSAAFTISEGVVTALSRLMVRWRSTASLKRKPVSSSVKVSLLHSMFRHR